MRDSKPFDDASSPTDVQTADQPTTSPALLNEPPLPRAWAKRWDWRESWAALQHWPWTETLRTLAQRFREDRLGLTASSLTFTTLIALVPLVTVMLAIFTAFPMFSSFQGALEKYFLKNLVPDTIAKPVLGAITLFANKAHHLGTAGLVALVFSALALMLTIDRTLNNIWRVRRARPIAQRVLVYWAAATLGPLVLGVSLSFTSYAVSASRGVVGGLPGGVSFVLQLIEFLMFAAAVSGLFRFVPNTQVLWRHALAGGLFVSLGFEVAKKGLAWYLSVVPGYSTVYGAFATVPILLVWVYSAWVIVLLGAVIAAYAPSLQMRVTRQPNTPGYRFEVAVKVLAGLAQARHTDVRGIAPADLAVALKIDPLLVDQALDTLMALDWVARLDESGAQRHVLLCDPASTRAAPLLARLVLGRSPALDAVWRSANLADLRVADVLPH